MRLLWWKKRVTLLRIAERGFRPSCSRGLVTGGVDDSLIDRLCGRKLFYVNGKLQDNACEHDLDELKRELKEMASSKHSQRAIRRNCPAPSQMTIPDDFVHYAEDRVLTVREMARLQSFPDWFRFYGKVTTGGREFSGL